MEKRAVGKNRKFERKLAHLAVDNFISETNLYRVVPLPMQ